MSSTYGRYVDFFNLFHIDLSVRTAVHLLFRFVNANIPQYFKYHVTIKMYSVVLQH